MENNLIKPTLEILCKTSHNMYLPTRANSGDAGADLRSTEQLVIYPNEQRMIDTGVAVKIPVGFFGLVCSRSSIGRAGLTIPHSVGIIDSGYRGNLKVILHNLGEDPYTISVGDKIAQLLILPTITASFKNYLDWDDSDRGEGGFGSTGKQ